MPLFCHNLWFFWNSGQRQMHACKRSHKTAGSRGLLLLPGPCWSHSWMNHDWTTPVDSSRIFQGPRSSSKSKHNTGGSEGGLCSLSWNNGRKAWVLPLLIDALSKKRNGWASRRTDGHANEANCFLGRRKVERCHLRTEVSAEEKLLLQSVTLFSYQERPIYIEGHFHLWSQTC